MIPKIQTVPPETGANLSDFRQVNLFEWKHVGIQSPENEDISSIYLHTFQRKPL